MTFLINFYFNIILLSTLWSTFSLPLPHYHPNTRKDITFFKSHFPTTSKHQKLTNQFSSFKGNYYYFLTFSLPPLAKQPRCLVGGGVKIRKLICHFRCPSKHWKKENGKTPFSFPFSLCTSLVIFSLPRCCR